MNIAILTAAGTGSRVGQEVPKQFLSIDDKPLIIYSLEKFQKCKLVDAIAVVCLEGWENVLKTYSKQYGISKLLWVFKGGETGMQSIQNAVFGLRSYLNEEDIVLIQDGIRVNTSESIIEDCINMTKSKGVAIAAIPIAEAPFLIDGEKIESLDRNKLLRTQTPHGIFYGALLRLHEEANKKGIKNTVATCTLLYELGYPLYFYEGSETRACLKKPTASAILPKQQ